MTLEVAIVGCGFFSREHQAAWARVPRARVIAFVDADERKAGEAAAAVPGAAAYPDLDALFAARRPGLVDIVTPPATHRALVARAAREKPVVVCQKPLAPTLAEAEALVGDAEAAGAELIVHENFRFMPWFIEAKRVIDAGLLGTPLGVSFRLRPGDGQGPQAYLNRQPYFQKMERFLIHETAIHLVDVFRFLLGEVTGVFARLKKLNPVIAGEDAGVVVFDFASGATGVFDGNRLVDHPSDNARMTMGIMYLEGTSGVLRLDGYGRLFLKPHGKDEREHPYAWEKKGYGGDCVLRQIEHIVAHVLDGAPIVNTGRDYLRNFAIEEAIYRSNAERRFIEI
jgi:predicted dehydrogenase